MALAMLGVRPPQGDEAQGGRLAPTLFRIATVGFGADIYTAGMLTTVLRVPRIPGWASAIAGDLVWFSLLLGTRAASSRLQMMGELVTGVAYWSLHGFAHAGACTAI